MLLGQSADIVLVNFATRILRRRLFHFHNVCFLRQVLIGIMHIVDEVPLIVIALLLFEDFLAHLVTLSGLYSLTFTGLWVLLEHRAGVAATFSTGPLLHLHNFRNRWLWNRARFMRIRIRATEVHHEVLGGLVFIALVCKIILNIGRSVFEVTKMCVLTSSYRWQERVSAPLCLLCPVNYR